MVLVGESGLSVGRDFCLGRKSFPVPSITDTSRP